MKQIEISLSSRDRQLLLKYGYPFEDIQRQLKHHASSRADAAISDDSFWWEQVLGQALGFERGAGGVHETTPTQSEPSRRQEQ